MPSTTTTLSIPTDTLASANATRAGIKPVLHVEVRVKNETASGALVRTDLVRDEVLQWLTDKFAVLSLDQEFTEFDDFQGPHARCLESVKVTECTGRGTARPAGLRRDGQEAETTNEIHQSRTAYRLDEIDIEVHPFQLHCNSAAGLLGKKQAAVTSDATQSRGPIDGEPPGCCENASPEARITDLPSVDLNGLWESLMFDGPLATDLLKALSRIVLLSCKKMDSWMVNWNKIALFYGPPGTGKTSLCRALAQKLSIRLSRCFPSAKLVEISAPSLGSKFFGESSKLVTTLADSVETLAEEEQEMLIMVFIDEIETLAAKREHTLAGQDPFDAVRAVNALLTGLDRLRRHSNILVLCTSNLVNALDPAFIDRVDIKQFVPQPSARVVYEIYRSCLTSLAASACIEGASFSIVKADHEASDSPLQCAAVATPTLELPTWADMLLWYQIFPTAAPTRLASIARKSVGLSARTLRRLPALALVLFTDGSTCRIDGALQALAQAVEEELRAKEQAGLMNG